MGMLRTALKMLESLAKVSSAFQSLEHLRIVPCHVKTLRLAMRQFHRMIEWKTVGRSDREGLKPSIVLILSAQSASRVL
jgi:hypothetical protein